MPYRVKSALEALAFVLAAPFVGAALALVIVVDLLTAKGAARPLPEDGPTGHRCSPMSRCGE